MFSLRQIQTALPVYDNLAVATNDALFASLPIDKFDIVLDNNVPLFARFEALFVD